MTGMLACVITATEVSAFDRGVRPLLSRFLPEKAEAILNLLPDPALQSRIEELASKSTEGPLTEAEMAEYAGYVRANKFVAMLQRKAREVLREVSEPANSR